MAAARAIITVGQNISNLTFYWVSATQLFILNADPGVTFSGDWVQQNVPFGLSAFNQSAFQRYRRCLFERLRTIRSRRRSVICYRNGQWQQLCVKPGVQ